MLDPGNRLVFVFLLGIVISLMISCATPTSPSGGEPDRTGPVVIETIPKNETTNFTGNRLIFEFEDFVDRNSFEQAFRMEPDLNLEYSISWRRQTARVTFSDPFPDTTTIVFTLGSDLRDTRNNRVKQPIQLAISTGPEIDRGKITARVLNAESGRIFESGKVLLYRHPVDLSKPANYIGEPDTSATITFNYLRGGEYKAFWLDDRNRNKIWDRDSEKAQPFYSERIVLEQDGEADFGTVYVIREDTTAPRLQAVGMHTSNRLRLRFSEPVTFSSESNIQILNQDGSHFSEAVPLFTQQGNRNIMFAESNELTEEDVDYKIEISGIMDRAGNEAVSTVDEFPGSAVEDTVLNRFIGMDNPERILYNQPVVLRYAKQITEPEIRDSLIVVDGTEELADWPFIEIEKNRFIINPDSIWSDTGQYEFRIWNPGVMDRRTIRVEMLQENDLGAISISLAKSLPEAAYFFRLINDQDEVVRAGYLEDETEIQELIPGNYRLIVFEDRNENGRWDYGSVEPYRKPAFYDVIREVPVQRGLTGSVIIGDPDLDEGEAVMLPEESEEIEEFEEPEDL